MKPSHENGPQNSLPRAETNSVESKELKTTKKTLSEDKKDRIENTDNSPIEFSTRIAEPRPETAKAKTSASLNESPPPRQMAPEATKTEQKSTPGSIDTGLPNEIKDEPTKPSVKSEKQATTEEEKPAKEPGGRAPNDPREVKRRQLEKSQNGNNS